jgi:hypothetical protein
MGKSIGIAVASVITMGLGVGHAIAADVSDLPVKTLPPAAPVPFFSIVDDRVTYAYLPRGTDPGNSPLTAKQTVTFTHFDAWAYGTNLVNLTLLKSDQRDPSAPCVTGGRTGCAGATEFYGFLRSTIGFNEVFNTKAFSIGALRNVSFEFGGDGEVENTTLAPAKRVGVVGLQFAFDLPYKGYINVAPMYFKEVNHSSFIPAPSDGTLNFNGTWAIETNYYMDLGFLPDYLPLSVSGRFAFYGPKGKGTSVPGTLERITELNSEPIRLTLDASRAVWGPKYTHLVDVWVAYKYWQNKYGLNHNRAPQCIGLNAGSCTESSVYSGVTVKF